MKSSIDNNSVNASHKVKVNSFVNDKLINNTNKEF